LIGGQTNPCTLLKSQTASRWWEDIWDRNNIKHFDYWPRGRSLCNRIEQAIQLSDRLAEMREKIRGDVLH
jgi:hypothetical protein